MAFQGDSIYWVEVEKVVPNPFQPRREFDQNKLQELAESIRMYGVLQPLTVTRNEVQRDNGTFYTEYELIAGERRLRASRLAGVAQVPVIIREGEQSEQEKLELAIIENLQREDLNAIDRALAFQQLAEQFKLNHAEVARKVGRSREYVANSIRLLQLPEHIRGALQRGELGEGHARTLLMLTDRPAEQDTIFREILLKKMSVREVERIVRKIATDKVRKPSVHDIDDHLIEIEKEFTETLGTRVQIQKTDFGGKLTIDYFSDDDLSALLVRVRAEVVSRHGESAAAQLQAVAPLITAPVVAPTPISVPQFERPVATPQTPVVAVPPIVSSVPAPTPESEIKPEQQPEPVSEPEPEPQPQPQATPEAAPVLLTPEPAQEPTSVHKPTPEPETTPEPTPAATPTITPPVGADPSLLSRLAAHTSLSFMTSKPAQIIEPEPEPEPEPEVQAPSSVPPSEPVVEVTAAPMPTHTPEPQKKSADDDDDIYSIRNFNV